MRKAMSVLRTESRLDVRHQRPHAAENEGFATAFPCTLCIRRYTTLNRQAACGHFRNSVIVTLSKYGGSMAAGKNQTEEQVARFADMFSAIGTGPRLRIMRVLLSAHPDGMVVGDIINELGITASTLSHHLDKLKNEDLVKVRREGTFLWYSANAEALQELLGFLYAECCTRNKAVEPQAIVRLCP
jgi:ArsR family transcriptional regulator